MLYCYRCCEYVLQLFTVGKLTSAPLWNIFSRKPREEDREGRQPFPSKGLTPGLEPVLQRRAAWAGCAPNLKTFTENHWTSCIFLPEGYLHREVEKQVTLVKLFPPKC